MSLWAAVAPTLFTAVLVMLLSANAKGLMVGYLLGAYTTSITGIVAKRLDAPYLPGRRGELWLKYKHRHRERLTVTASGQATFASPTSS